MRVIEMECEGCFRLVRTSQNGAQCGPCDLAMCTSCLNGTARCPSCQKPFAETQDRPPVVMATAKNDEPPWLRVALLAGLAIALALAYVSFSGPSVTEEPAPYEHPRAIDWSLTRPAISNAPCPTSLRGHVVPSGPVVLPDLLGGPRALRAVLAQADATVILPDGVDLAVDNVMGSAPTDLVLVVDEWREPTMLNHPGRLRGRVYLRDREYGRISCGGLVDVSDLPGDYNGFEGVQRARVELVRVALANGVAALRAVQ